MYTLSLLYYSKSMFWKMTDMTRETSGVGKDRKHMYELVFSCHNSELRDYSIEMGT
jgi:hypothetical protein